VAVSAAAAAEVGAAMFGCAWGNAASLRLGSESERPLLWTLCDGGDYGDDCPGTGGKLVRLIITTDFISLFPKISHQFRNK
jgi:hypothetical protein